jgi:hypothetical protein
VDSYVGPTIEHGSLYLLDEYPVPAHLLEWRGKISITSGLDNHNFHRGFRPSGTDQIGDSRSLPACQHTAPSRRTDVHVDL